MNWKIEISNKAEKTLKKLDTKTQRRILDYLKSKISPTDNPKNFGKPLVGNFTGLWRYRVGDYRIICEIKSDKVKILVLKIDHRKNIYK